MLSVTLNSFYFILKCTICIVSTIETCDEITDSKTRKIFL